MRSKEWTVKEAKKTTYAEATKKPKKLQAPIAGEYKGQTQTRRDKHNPRPYGDRELVLPNGNSKVSETPATTQAEEDLEKWNRLQARLMKIADKKNAAIQLSNHFQVLASVHPTKKGETNQGRKQRRSSLRAFRSNSWKLQPDSEPEKRRRNGKA